MVDPNIRSITAIEPRKKARQAVATWVDAHTEITDATPRIDPDKDIYVVWFCKTLQNWKALLSTTRPDGMYYECTYDGDAGKLYLDCYKKFDNVMFKDPDPEVENRAHITDGNTPCWCKPDIEYVHGKGRRN
jgi:hypothetical protein